MKNSNIAWTDHTFNPWIGCTKVSAGCLHCYAEARDKRYDKGIHWGKDAPRRRTTVANWGQPFRWAEETRRAAAITINGSTPAHMARPRVFCASLADWMDDEIPLDWLADLMDVVRLTTELDWLLLTKRPENIKPRLLELLNPAIYDNEKEWQRSGGRRDWIMSWLVTESAIPKNVWLGTSVENQAAAAARIPHLLEIPSTVRFLSCEPLLEAVDLGNEVGTIDWVIVGGESGAGARPMDEAWARSLRDQCAPHSTAFFMKQLGGAGDKRDRLEDMPEDLQLREFP